MPNVQVSVSLDEETLSKIDQARWQVASEDGEDLSRSAVVQDAMGDWMDEHEDDLTGRIRELLEGSDAGE